jgi:hypothetical protein
VLSPQLPLLVVTIVMVVVMVSTALFMAAATVATLDLLLSLLSPQPCRQL